MEKKNTNTPKQKEGLRNAAGLHVKEFVRDDSENDYLMKQVILGFTSGANWQKERDKETINSLLSALKDAQANIIEIKSNVACKVVSDSPVLRRIKSAIEQAEQTINTNN
jgi:hypothetical protein